VLFIAPFFFFPSLRKIEEFHGDKQNEQIPAKFITKSKWPDKVRLNKNKKPDLSTRGVTT
jgi:hypothetical protein